MLEKFPASNCDEVIVVPMFAACKVDHLLRVRVVELCIEGCGEDGAELCRREPWRIGGTRVQDRPILIELDSIFWT